MKKTDSESHGRISRPTTVEIRHELIRMTRDSSKGSLNEFELGVIAALEWTLGERRTLRR